MDENIQKTALEAPVKRTILIVEDNADLRSATGDLLGSLGHEVTAVRDGARALEALEHGSFDLALVNAYPAEGSGLQTVDRLRRREPALAALLVSGFGDDLELRHRVVAHDVGFLAVPYSRESLQAEIDATIEHAIERSVSPTSPSPLPESGVTHSTWTARSRRWLLAASLVLAVGVVAQLRSAPPSLPEPDLAEVRRGQTIEHVEPDGEIDSLPERLVWRGSPGASRYRVVLMTLDETTLWLAETRNTSIEFPRHVRARLSPAVKYYWRVEGLARNFSHTGSSPLIAFWSAPSGPTSN